MNKFFLSTLLVLILGSCSSNNNQKLETFITGAEIAGVNGMHLVLMGIYTQHLLLVLILQSSILKTKTLLKGMVYLKESLVLMMLLLIQKESFSGHQYLLEKLQVSTLKVRKL